MNHLEVIHDILVLLAGHAGGGSYELLLAKVRKELGRPLSAHDLALLEADEHPAVRVEPTPDQLLAEWRAKQQEASK